MLPREEVIKRLRARGEPITLFGETDIMRLERLRKLELKKPMEYIEGVESVYIQTIREEDNSDEHDILKKMNVDPIFVIEDREPVNEQEQVLFWGRVSIEIINNQLNNLLIFPFLIGAPRRMGEKIRTKTRKGEEDSRRKKRIGHPQRNKVSPQTILCYAQEECM